MPKHMVRSYRSAGNKSGRLEVKLGVDRKAVKHAKQIDSDRFSESQRRLDKLRDDKLAGPQVANLQDEAATGSDRDGSPGRHQQLQIKLVTDWAPDQHEPTKSEKLVELHPPVDEEALEMASLRSMLTDGQVSKRPRSFAASDRMTSISVVGGAARISADHKTITAGIRGGVPMDVQRSWDNDACPIPIAAPVPTLSSGSQVFGGLASWGIGSMHVSEGLHSWVFTIDRYGRGASSSKAPCMRVSSGRVSSEIFASQFLGSSHILSHSIGLALPWFSWHPHPLSHAVRTDELQPRAFCRSYPMSIFRAIHMMRPSPRRVPPPDAQISPSASHRGGRGGRAGRGIYL